MIASEVIENTNLPYDFIVYHYFAPFEFSTEEYQNLLFF